MGCNMSCMAPELTEGPMDIVYEDTRISLTRRPRDFHELLLQILKIVPDVKSTYEIVLEYSCEEGIKSIMDDVSLQEAYIRAYNEKLIVGVRHSNEYIPFEVRVRGSNSSI